MLRGRWGYSVGKVGVLVSSGYMAHSLLSPVDASAKSERDLQLQQIVLVFR